LTGPFKARTWSVDFIQQPLSVSV